MCGSSKIIFMCEIYHRDLLLALINFQLFILDTVGGGGKGREDKNVKYFYAAMIKSIPSIFLGMRRPMGKNEEII